MKNYLAESWLRFFAFEVTSLCFSFIDEEVSRDFSPVDMQIVLSEVTFPTGRLNPSIVRRITTRGARGVVNVAHEGRSTCRRRDFLARTCFFPPLSCSPSISIYIPLSLFPFRVKSVIAGRLRERKREGERVMENIPVAILVRRPDDRKRKRSEKENVRVRGNRGEGSVLFTSCSSPCRAMVKLRWTLRRNSPLFRRCKSLYVLRKVRTLLSPSFYLSPFPPSLSLYFSRSLSLFSLLTLFPLRFLPFSLYGRV